MLWRAVIDELDELRSITSEQAADIDLDPGWEIVELGDYPRAPSGVWNKAQKRLDPPPADPDRTAAATVTDTPAVRTKLRNVANGSEMFTAGERDRVLAFVALKLLGG